MKTEVLTLALSVRYDGTFKIRASDPAVVTHTCPSAQEVDAGSFRPAWVSE